MGCLWYFGSRVPCGGGQAHRNRICLLSWSSMSFHLPWRWLDPNETCLAWQFLVYVDWYVRTLRILLIEAGMLFVRGESSEPMVPHAR